MVVVINNTSHELLYAPVLGFSNTGSLTKIVLLWMNKLVSPQKKREAEVLQKTALKFVELSTAKLDQLPLDDALKGLNTF